MKQVTKHELKKMIIDAFEAHYNDYYDKTYNFDSYVKLITAHDDFSDMLRKYNIFIGYLLGYMSAEAHFYNTSDKIKNILLESNEVTLLIYAFGGDNDAIFALKGKGIELVNSL